MNNIKLQYLGFLKTPNLWLDASNFGLEQIELPNKISNLNISNNHRLRLGKLVERFVSQQLNEDENISILAENIQIQDGKTTIGEFDCLIKKNKEVIHIEVVYKFYLYDDTVGTSEIDHWIGPNRKDSLNQKLNKLKEKQLPLLYHPLTRPMLESLNLQVDSIQQKVCFKAQLFVPFQKKNIQFKSINNSCIKGFYLTQEQLQQFTDCQFYIPKKLDWLIEISNHTNWLGYNIFLEQLTPILNKKLAPLCWIKRANGNTEKCFVVWW